MTDFTLYIRSKIGRLSGVYMRDGLKYYKYEYKNVGEQMEGRLS